MKGERISFGRLKEVLPIPDLISIQTKSYSDFLQRDVPPEKRKRQGLQAILMDTFPPKDSGSPNAFGLEFIKYEIREQSSDLQELLKSGGTYQGDIYVDFRMRGASSKEIHEETIRMGHIPLMTPSGSFIINGSERVIVSQLHRSPGVCFESNRHPSGRMLYSYKIIADHGSWLEVQFDTKGRMQIYLDRKRRRRKFLVSTFLFAFGYNGTREILDAIYGVETKSISELSALADSAQYKLAEEIQDADGVVVSRAMETLTADILKALKSADIKEVPVYQQGIYGESFSECLKDIVYPPPGDEDKRILTCEEAQKQIYKKMRPSDPASASNARDLFQKMFQDERRYDLGLVGRFKMNQLLGIHVDPNVRTLTKEDIAAATRKLMEMKETNKKEDDIDHLSRRRIRTIGELLQNQCRVGLIRVANAARERMSNGEDKTIAKLVTAKSFESVVTDFFQHNQLSQFMDQTNCLSELTNKRRLSALGPGGLQRDRAGTEVRDVHSSHYGRICPIETPEGPNIGLISSLALYSQIDEFGFIMTPYCKVKNGRVETGRDGKPKIVYMKADEEEDHVIAQANAPRDEKGAFVNDYVLARKGGEAGQYPKGEVEYIDVSPKQMISAAASVITFLEHDDANRALMGCNMQRQAVPLMKPERPLVGTGMEGVIARYSHAVQTATRDGVVAWSDGFKVIVTPDGTLPKGTTQADYTANLDTPEIQVYILYKFLRSNACTLVNQRPLVRPGEAVKAEQALADGSCTDEGELALGRNVLVAFMSWHGYNFEDAIIISEKLVQDDVYTSIHINLQEVEAKETKHGSPEEITRDIPNVSPEALSNLDTEGVIRIGAEVQPGSVLVGKVSPRNESDLTPEEHLLKAIFGEKASDVKDTSLKTENGNDGVVMDLRIKRAQDPKKVQMTKAELKTRQAETRAKYSSAQASILDEIVKELGDEFLQQKMHSAVTVENPETHAIEEVIPADRKVTKLMLGRLAQNYDNWQMKDCDQKTKIEEIIKKYRVKLNNNKLCCEESLELLKKNDGSDPGTIKSVMVYIASKRRLSVGDKMAGRHGNKGIVSKVVPVADLPFLADGTPVDIILNPLGVPSRMNIGQVFETHAGWAAKVLGINIATPAFDGLPEARMADLLERARLVKIAEAAHAAVPESVMKGLRQVDGKAVEEAKQSLRKLISAKGWQVGERDDSKSTGGVVIDENGIDRTDDFIDIDGKTRVYDGFTGDAFAQRVTVGQIYMLKLDHLVVNKIHARAVGPYSLITQQPLGGKAQQGGQRFGEMEVWALEAYGAAYTLQEMLTVKSDDTLGRTKIYNSILAGNNELEPGVPESFNVLTREMMSLCLDVRINHANSNMA